MVSIKETGHIIRNIVLEGGSGDCKDPANDGDSLTDGSADDWYENGGNDDRVNRTRSPAVADGPRERAVS